MTRRPHADREAARAASEVARRAIRRLNVLEWLILATAVGMAIGGGAVVAALLAEPMGVSYEWAWTGLSLFLFGVPGAIVVLRLRKEERAEAEMRSSERERDDV